MNARLILFSAIALGAPAGIAIHQARVFASLKAETRSLKESLAAPPLEAVPDALTPVEMARQAGAAAAALFRSEGDPAVHLESWFLSTESLDIPALASLIRDLENDPGLEPYRKDCANQLIRALSTDSPARAMALTKEFPGLTGDQGLANSILRRWLLVDPAAASRWFEDERAKGNPVTAAPDVQLQAIQALLRTDPDRGLAIALTLLPDGTDPIRTTELAIHSIQTLADPTEHARYLAALRRAATRSPGDAKLGSIRATYLNELPARLGNWTFEEVTSLIDGELTASERITTAGNIARFDLEAPEKWADWFAGIAATPEASAPIGRFIHSWSVVDQQAADRWLDRQPAGPKRDELLAGIRAEWEKSDPDAAERFARKHGLRQ